MEQRGHGSGGSEGTPEVSTAVEAVAVWSRIDSLFTREAVYRALFNGYLNSERLHPARSQCGNSPVCEQRAAR